MTAPLQNPNAEETILTVIKNFIGISTSDPHFDDELLMHINLIIAELEIVGTTNKVIVCSKDTVWTDYLVKEVDIASIQTLIGMKVKMVFDPPANSFLVESYNKQIDKMEWLLTVKKEGEPNEPIK